MMETEVKEKIKEGNRRVMDWVFSRFGKENWPEIERKEQVNGYAFVRSYPILGIEKYLGMWDSDRRLPYFPSLKLTNDSYSTYMYAEFNETFDKDEIIFGGKPAEGKELKRFMKIVNKFREITGIRTHVKIISKHVPKIGNIRGKGLGLSASASGAAASALLAAAGYVDLYNNNRFLSYLARYLSGSGTSSAAGGFSVWFGYEGIDEIDSYGVKIDDGNWVDLVIVPIPLEGFKTSSAHKAAVASPFYYEWAVKKPEWVLDLMEGIVNHDIDVVGKHAEKDAYWLTMLMSTGGNYVNYMPTTIDVIREVVRIRREEGINAYYTMDTGPSVVVITEKGKGELILEMLKSKFKDLTIYISKSAGCPEILSNKDDINKAKEILNME